MATYVIPSSPVKTGLPKGPSSLLKQYYLLLFLSLHFNIPSFWFQDRNAPLMIESWAVSIVVINLVAMYIQVVETILNLSAYGVSCSFHLKMKWLSTSVHQFKWREHYIVSMYNSTWRISRAWLSSFRNRIWQFHELRSWRVLANVETVIQTQTIAYQAQTLIEKVYLTQLGTIAILSREFSEEMSSRVSRISLKAYNLSADASEKILSWNETPGLPSHACKQRGTDEIEQDQFIFPIHDLFKHF